MDNNEDFLITDQTFINFLVHGESRNMTNISWNASSTTNLSHTCLNSLPYGHNENKTYTNERMVMILDNLYKLDMSVQQVYKGPLGINSFILESYSINANKLQRFLHTKKNRSPNYFYQYYKIIEAFLSHCSEYLNKHASNIYDLDLYDEKLFTSFYEKKLLTSQINYFKKIYSLYFSNEEFLRSLNKTKKTEEFNHIFLEQHLNEVRKECTQSSLKRRKRDYKNFFYWLVTVYKEFHNYSFNSIPLYLVNTCHLEEYKVFLLGQYHEGIYKKHTISDVYYNIRSLFKYLYQMRLIPNDISKNVNSIKFEKYKYRDLPTDQHLSEFFNAVLCYTPDPLKFCLAYKLMLHLGLRLSEVATLESSNINFSTNTISVKGKGNKYNILPLPKLLIDDLHTLININNKYVFSDQPQKFKNELYHYYKLLSFIINWDFPGGVHIFRHTFITRLTLQLNPKPNVIKFLSRHERPDTTSLYIHRDNKSLNNAINKINYF